MPEPAYVLSPKPAWLSPRDSQVISRESAITRSLVSSVVAECYFLRTQPFTLSKKVQHQVQRPQEKESPSGENFLLSGMIHNQNQSHSRKWISMREERDVSTE